jgi:uncharacterized OB-fold protein
MMKKEDSPDNFVVDARLLQLPSPACPTGALLGNRCRTCGESFFPSRYGCRNCTSDDMEEILLSTKGTLYAFTTIRVKLPHSKVAAPFLMGIIELPEGERIRSLLTECDSDTIRIGDEMELVVDKAYTDDEGNDILGWKFKPAEAKQ